MAAGAGVKKKKKQNEAKIMAKRKGRNISSVIVDTRLFVSVLIYIP
jgi:hypothetical protein